MSSWSRAAKRKVRLRRKEFGVVVDVVEGEVAADDDDEQDAAVAAVANVIVVAVEIEIAIVGANATGRVDMMALESYSILQR